MDIIMLFHRLAPSIRSVFSSCNYSPWIL